MLAVSTTIAATVCAAFGFMVAHPIKSPKDSATCTALEFDARVMHLCGEAEFPLAEPLGLL